MPEPEHQRVPRPYENVVFKKAREANSPERARLVMAGVALIRLHYGNTDGTTRELFAWSGPKENKYLRAEVSSKGWQRDFLHRLLAANWVMDQPGGGYRATYTHDELGAAETDDLVQAIHSVFSGDGLVVKKLLWPVDYAEPETNDGPDDGSAEANEDQSGSLLLSLTQALGSLVETTKGVAELAKNLEHAMDAIDERLGAKLTAVERGVIEIQAAAAAFNAASEKYDKLVGMLEDDRRRQIAVMAEKLSENTQKERGLMNQLDGVSNKKAEMLATLHELLKGGNQ